MREDNEFMNRLATWLIAWMVRGSAVLGIALSAMVPGQAVEDQRSIPEPVAIWASSPLDVMIAFPRPVTTRLADSLVGRTIPYFHAKPPALPVGSIRIAGARLIDNGRTMVVATDPHSSPAAYHLDLAPAGETRHDPGVQPDGRRGRLVARSGAWRW